MKQHLQRNQPDVKVGWTAVWRLLVNSFDILHQLQVELSDVVLVKLLIVMSIFWTK